MEILFCLVIAYYLVKNTGLEAYKTATGKESAAHRERLQRSKAGVQTVPDAFAGRLAHWMTPKPDKPPKERGAARETAATIWRYSWDDGRNRFIRHHDRKIEGTLPRQKARRAVVGAAKRVPVAVRDVRNSEIRTAKRELKRNPNDADAHDRYWAAVDAKKGRTAGPTVVDPAPEFVPADATGPVNVTTDPPVEPTDAADNVFPLRPTPESDASPDLAGQERGAPDRPQSYAEIRAAITKRWPSNTTTDGAEVDVPQEVEQDTNGQQATTEGDNSMDDKEREYWANPLGVHGGPTGENAGLAEVLGVDSLRTVYEVTNQQVAGLQEQLGAAKSRVSALGSTYEQGTAHLSSEHFDDNTISAAMNTQEMAAAAQRKVDEATTAVEALAAAASAGYAGLERFRPLEEASAATPEAADVGVRQFQAS